MMTGTANASGPKAFIGFVDSEPYKFEGVFVVNSVAGSRTESCSSSQSLGNNYGLFGVVDEGQNEFLVGKIEEAAGPD